MRTNQIKSSNSVGTESNAVSVPQISLPKGGGALKGIDEKFSVNTSNGTTSLSIPLPITEGRNGFQPLLSLDYNSGSGNSPFGLGWNLTLPAIQRKTEKKLPLYLKDEESDVFMFSGVEDLVPALKKEGDVWINDEESTGSDHVKKYWPRTEGLFSRIEKVQPAGSNSFYWKVTSRNNIVTFFGLTSAHRIADPADSSKIFKWLPEISFDDKGNYILYEYKQEDIENVANSLFEKNRLTGLATAVNQYVKRVKYGNIRPYYPDYNNSSIIYAPVMPVDDEFLFEVVFDYGEHGDDEYNETSLWPARADAYSDYRAGFDIRTRRLCRRIMMFHHFTNREFGLADNDDRIPYLVKSLDLEYSFSSEQHPEVTYLESARQTGYKKIASGYEKRSLPSMEFTYQPLKWNKTIESISPENITNAPAGWAIITIGWICTMKAYPVY